ncbi:MAG: AAA family ATPase [Planctomycetes bacterium]|nr:AAA family ATPase [Planctomycetota bacterium]
MASTEKLAKWSLRVNAKIRRSICRAADAGHVAAMFGLAEGRREVFYDDLAIELAPGRIVAVTGPSGAGKTLLLRAVARELPRVRRLDLESLARSNRPAVTVLRGGGLTERLGMLARCGLAEAASLVMPARFLSGGQRVRLALAAVLHAAMRSKGPEVVIADEFGTCLDFATAAVLCRRLRRLISRSNVAMLLATPHAELLADLQPDLVIHKPLSGPAAVSADVPRRRLDGPETWPIVRGSIHDYDRLGVFHYMGGRPACHKRIYVIRRPPGGRGRWDRPDVPDLAAVLVVSPPLGSVRGRNLATGGRYAGPDRAAALRRLNAEIECISRVVVHPTFRGLGLAVRLVRHALATAETPLVEALAAMGRLHPFFERAGMRAFYVPPDKRIGRLLRAAGAVGLSADDLAAVAPVRRILARSTSPRARFLRRELSACIAGWFDRQRIERLCDPVAEICRLAGRRYAYYLADRTAG